MMVTGFIIEHETRGTLVDMDADPYSTHSANVYNGWRSKFSWSGPRSGAMYIGTLAQAQEALYRIHPKIRRQCTIRKFGTWEVVDATNQS